jgi:hypothetical protein
MALSRFAASGALVLFVVACLSFFRHRPAKASAH